MKKKISLKAPVLQPLTWGDRIQRATNVVKRCERDAHKARQRLVRARVRLSVVKAIANDEIRRRA